MSEVGPRLGSALTELHFRYFCDKLAAAFCPAYFDYIFRQVLWSADSTPDFTEGDGGFEFAFLIPESRQIWN